ncbi:MAG: YceI family protein [Flavobacteriales bacterium]|nr:YceI family protein [Flavobacteriales bacterium]HRH69741.1 YceI family protein [Flavobacteriales bacterium]
MKSPVLSVVALSALFLVACGPSEAEIAAAKEKAAADSIAALAAMEMTYAVDIATSKVNWTGTMLGVKSHNGTINLTEGFIRTKGGNLTGGDFAIDMKSIAPLDTNYAPAGSKQGTKDDLVGHLSSADFFAVDSFPVAKFSISAVEGNTATGSLSLRGRTNEEKLTDIVLTPNADGTLTATCKVSFDRQKYGAAWKAPMKDVVLNDAIELTVELTGKAQ